MRRSPIVLLPAIPAIALLSAVWLPFVNTEGLWFGVPRLFVWCSVWVFMITPTLLVVDRDRRAREARAGAVGAAADSSGAGEAGGR